MKSGNVVRTVMWIGLIAGAAGSGPCSSNVPLATAPDAGAGAPDASTASTPDASTPGPCVTGSVGLHATSPTALVTTDGTVAPLAIAVDATNVYYSVYASASHTNDAIMSVPKGGGTPVVVAANQDEVGHLLVDDTNLYWIAGGGQNGFVRTMPKAGGAITTIAQGPAPDGVDTVNPDGLAVDKDNLYWGDSNTGALTRVPKDGSAATLLITQSSHGLRELASDGTNVYLGDSDGELFNVPINGGLEKTLVPGLESNPLTIALFGDDVVWVHQQTSSVTDVSELQWAPKAGGTATTIEALPQDGPRGIFYVAADQSGIYWTEGPQTLAAPVPVPPSDMATSTVSPLVRMVSAVDGTPTSLATGVGIGAGMIALDATNIYWVQSNTIMTLSKPSTTSGYCYGAPGTVTLSGNTPTAQSCAQASDCNGTPQPNCTVCPQDGKQHCQRWECSSNSCEQTICDGIPPSSSCSALNADCTTSGCCLNYQVEICQSGTNKCCVPSGSAPESSGATSCCSGTVSSGRCQ